MIKYLLLFLSTTAFADYKVLVNEWDGSQGIIVLKDVQKYSGDNVVWDESKLGPLPKDAPIGSAELVDDKPTGKVSLVSDPTMLAAKQARDQAAADKIAAAQQAETDFAALKTKVLDKTATQDDINNLVRAIIIRQ